MRIRFFLLIGMLIGSTLSLQAQRNKTSGNITGTVVDSSSKEALSAATVTLLQASDSSTVSFSISGNKGEFELNSIPFGQYVLELTFTGYLQVYKSVSLSKEEPDAKLGNLLLSKDAQLLGEVVVKSPPIIMKKDTVEFNAGSFKTREGATAEELLKKLPGVQVGKDGTITAQGSQVSRVLVDGKEFFGNDPKLATQNLPADMIDKVQVFDRSSDQAAFSGIEDANREKTINIKLKKDKKKGEFGKFNAGAGLADGGPALGEGKITYNRFNGAKQMAVLANGGNTNKQGFTFQDISGAMGNQGGGFRMGGSGGFSFGNLNFGNNMNQGITESFGAGANFRNSYGTNLDVNGSYFFNNGHTGIDRNVFRQNFTTNNVVKTTETDRIDRNNINHRLNAVVEWKIDSNNSIRWQPNVVYQNNDNTTLSEISNANNTNPKASTALNKVVNKTEAINWSNELLWRHRFNKKGRTFSLSFNNTFANTDGNGFNSSDTRFFDVNGNQTGTRLFDQRNFTDNDTRNYRFNASYTEPLSKTRTLEISATRTDNKTISDRQVFDFNANTSEYDKPNVNLSNLFKNTFTANRAGFALQTKLPKLTYNIGLAVQSGEQVSNNLSKQTIITNKFTNWFPTANLTYNAGRNRNLRVNYRGQTNQPSAQQLQPVPDISNPLNIRIGNPNLKQEFNNNLNVFYNFFDFTKFKTFFTGLNVSNTFNKVVNDVVLETNGAQTTTYVNEDGNWNANAFASIGIPLNGQKFTLNTTTSIGYFQDINYINKQQNKTSNSTITESLILSYTHKEKWDASVNASVIYNNARYSIQSELNQRYFTQNYQVDFNYNIAKGLVFNTDWDITVNTGRTDGFNQTIAQWNMFLAKTMGKKKNMELRLSVYDILNQNQFINRTVSNTIIEDVRVSTLRRYGLLSFTYNLGKFQGANMMMPRFMQKNLNKARFN